VTAKIVIDTNLLVAAVFRPGAPGPAGVLERWRDGRATVCVSGPVLREMRATLGRLPVEPARKAPLLDLLEDPGRTRTFDPVPDSGWRCADPSDDKFLHLALAAGADALVTADRALLEVRDFPLPILKSGQRIARAGR
jgi:putative PIN family toxin of toxin-antitoxin system